MSGLSQSLNSYCERRCHRQYRNKWPGAQEKLYSQNNDVLDMNQELQALGQQKSWRSHIWIWTKFPKEFLYSAKPPDYNLRTAFWVDLSYGSFHFMDISARWSWFSCLPVKNKDILLSLFGVNGFKLSLLETMKT